MFSNLHYAYIIGDILLLCIWFVFFIARKDLRKEMLIISILSVPFGFTQYFFGADYWHPYYIIGNYAFGLEDLLYMFATGGITGVIYEEFFGKKLSKRHTRSHPYLMLLFVILGLGALFVGTKILLINSIYVSSGIFLFAGILTIIVRHDLLKHAFFSGLSLGFLTLVFDIFYLFLFPNIFQSWWSLSRISGFLVLGVPVEELIFAFMFGFVAGPMYEFVFGLKLNK